MIISVTNSVFSTWMWNCDHDIIATVLWSHNMYSTLWIRLWLQKPESPTKVNRIKKVIYYTH